MPAPRTPRHLLLLAGLAAAPAAAQDGAPACPRGRITSIFVDNGSVFRAARDSLDPRFAWAYRAGNRLHVRTRESFIRRALLFREGDCLDAALLADSERVLRAESFIADADVFAVPQPDGSQHVVVQTRDEWSLRVEPQADSDAGVGLQGVEVREDNLLGTGTRLAGFAREQDGERVYGASVALRQLAGTLWQAELAVERTPVGHGVAQRLARPFRGEAGRWAFRQGWEQAERNFVFYVPEAGRERPRRWLYPERRRAVDVGLLHRIGRRGNLTLFGLALTGEWAEFPSDSLIAPADDPRPALAPGLGEVTGLDSLAAVRLVFLAGQRNVWYRRRTGLDAVRGEEDVRLGVEIETAVGRSLEPFSTDDDLALQLGFSLAGDLPGGVLAGVRLAGEGQRNFEGGADGEEWRNVFGQADVWAYWRPGPASRYTWVAALRGDGGWRTTVPFQLSLGSRAGLRGHPRHAEVGRQRLVASLEHRAFLGGPLPDLLDLGTAVFLDAGRIWPGDDPFARPGGWHAGAGAGLRLAFPPGSRRTYRVDVAVPVAPRLRPGDVQVYLSIGQAVGRGAVDDDAQLRRSARRALRASLFSFPN